MRRQIGKSNCFSMKLKHVHPNITPMKHKQYPKGLDDSQRDKDGEIREKGGNTLVRTLRKEYGPDFAKGVSLEYETENRS